jgi:hypothetical protein
LKDARGVGMNCGILAGFSSDVSSLKRLSKELKFKLLDQPNEYYFWNTNNDLWKKTIQKADFYVAVIEKLDPELIFYLGIAVGQNKPLFLIVNRDIELPSFLNNYFYVRASIKEYDTIKFSLAQFVKSIPRQKSSNYLSYSKKLRKINFSDEWFTRLENIRENGSGEDFEKFLEDVFKNVGTEAMAFNTFSRDQGVDFAFWIDEVDQITGNPILIEAKFGILNSEIIDSAEAQLANYINKVHGKFGIVIYCDRYKKLIDSCNFTTPYILTIEIEEFIKRLNEDNFSKFIISERNRIVHGRER